MLADFGVLIDWRVGVTTTEDILALFDNGTVVEDGLSSLGVLGRRATLTMRESDLPANTGAAADVVTVGGVAYHPKAVLPDGSGLVVVTLEKS